MEDITRENNFHQKKGVCLFAAEITEGAEDGQIGVASEDYLLANLPPDAVIVDAYVHVETASDAATSAAATLGTTEGGSEILSAADLKSTGDEGTFTGQSLTGTGKSLYLGIAAVGASTAVGKYIVVVEYLEYKKNNGEYTKIN
jgi:hypothetical protein